MKKIITLSVLICISGPALAEPSSLVAFDRETRALIRSGNAEHAVKWLKKAKCKKCHSENGISDDTDTPSIAGMSATYIFKELMDFKNGSRSERSMKKAVKKLNKQDISDLAAYYASKTPDVAAYATKTVPVLVHRGDKKRTIKACNSCHGQNGEGGKNDMPRLIGQRKGYFASTLSDFKEGDRSNDIYSRMRDIAKELTDEEIDQLANYYSAIDPPDDEENDGNDDG